MNTDTISIVRPFGPWKFLPLVPGEGIPHYLAAVAVVAGPVAGGSDLMFSSCSTQRHRHTARLSGTGHFLRSLLRLLVVSSREVLLCTEPSLHHNRKKLVVETQDNIGLIANFNLYPKQKYQLNT